MLVATRIKLNSLLYYSNLYFDRKKYRETLLVTSKYCQTVNCETIEVSDCEIRLVLYSLSTTRSGCCVHMTNVYIWTFRVT